jgi:dienelactone hydrolase
MFASAAAAQGGARDEMVIMPGAEIARWGQVEQVRGRFVLPAGAKAKAAAVLILHGSGGVDGRGAFHAQALQEAGVATLEIEMFPRGGRPRAGQRATMPHAAAALRWLAAQPGIDAARLGVMGFSYGGAMSVYMAGERVQERLGGDVPRPAAFAALYPVCSGLARALVDANHSFHGVHLRVSAAPVLIQLGTRDDYEQGERPCDRVLELLPAPARERWTVRYFEGATHGFDGLRAMQFYDEAAGGGRGARVNVVPSAKDAEEARRALVAFFLKHL